MKCQILFSGKNKKNIINLSSAENAQRVVKVKDIGVLFNNWKWWRHAYLYIPLNFKSNRNIPVKIKI